MNSDETPFYYREDIHHLRKREREREGEREREREREREGGLYTKGNRKIFNLGEFYFNLDTSELIKK